MAADLSADLTKEFGDQVNVVINPVPDEGIKYYQLLINDEMWFDFQAVGGTDIKIGQKPNDKWTGPINYSTHEKYFGPFAPWKLQELKDAIKAKL